MNKVLKLYITLENQRNRYINVRGYKMRKVLITTLIILLAALVGAGAYVYNLLDMMPEPNFVDTDGSKIADKTPEEKKEALGISEDTKTQEDTGVTNILLFGLDNRSEGEK